MEVKQMMNLFLKIYGAYYYVKGYLHGVLMGMRHGRKAYAIYREAQNNGGFDEVTRAKLMKVAREYQAESPLYENAYDIIRRFDDCMTILNFGVHYF